MPDNFYATLGRHQALMALFDIAQHPERESELREAFDRMDDMILGNNVAAAAGVREAVVCALFVAAHALAVPKGQGFVDPAAAKTLRERLARLADGLSAEASEAIQLAEAAPTIHAFKQAVGPRRKAGPLTNSVLVEAAVVVVRAMADHHGESTPESRWMVLGQFSGSMCVGG